MGGGNSPLFIRSLNPSNSSHVSWPSASGHGPSHAHRSNAPFQTLQNMSDEVHGKGKGATGDKPSETATVAATATAPHDATNGIMAHAGTTAENEATAANDDLALDKEDVMEIERITEEGQRKGGNQQKKAVSDNKAASATTATAEKNGESASATTSKPAGAKKAASAASDTSTGARSAPPSNAPKEIEVLDPALNYQQVRVLKSVSEGNRVMGVSRHMLSKVCDAGGGVINSDKFGTKYFYRYTAAATAPPAAAKAKVGRSTAGPGSQQQHLTAAALRRHDESHQYHHHHHLKQQQYQPQANQPTGNMVGKQTEPQKKAAAVSSQFYGGTFPFYSAQSGPPPPSAIGYLNSSILRATMSASASAPRQEAKSTLRRPSTGVSSGASSAKMVSYSAYPPTQFPSAEEIEASIPANASSIFHVLDRRINFDNFSKDASFYSLLRGWIKDDPYRSDASMHKQLLAGGDWVQANEDGRDDRPKKRQRAIAAPVDVLALLRQQKGSTDQPTMVELRTEHVARAKEIQLEARKLDRLKMARARESLERRYGVTL